MRYFLAPCLFLVTCFILWQPQQLAAQDKQYKVAAIGFYNLENLFDTIDDPKTNDADFLPTGSYNYTGAIYQEKLQKLSGVISELGTEVTPDGVAILGVAEIENRSVLEDLVKQPALIKRGYKVVHYDSPDRRGVDVGLIYNPKYFKVEGSKPLYVEMPIHGEDTSYTRDILWVWGVFDGEPMHVFVNHWPSRRGGEVASAPLRDNAAAVCRKVIDSLLTANPNIKIMAMGDLNDDPTNNSVQNVMQAKGKIEKLKPGELYNPFYALYKKGIGSLAWNDSWNLFDQIVLSQGLLNSPSNAGYYFLRNEVYNRNYLTQQSGHFKGYPHRTYVGGTYQGGYSDHFPVYLFLIKEVK